MFNMKKINLIGFVLITITLVVFDIYKAAHASLTIDESDTYLDWVNSPIMDIISYKHAGTNNHILNTLLMKFFQALFGTSQFILRLPNVIAHILYLVFSFKIFTRYSKTKAILFFILINANPFLIDFFSLARGYGIAIALMTSGFYFYCRYIEDQKNKYHILSLLLLCLAALANFALISLVLVFVFTHNILQFFIFKRKFSLKNLWQVNYINGIFLFLLAAVCYIPIQKIIKLKLLYFGGMDSFWKDTVGSMAETFSYFSPYQSFIAIGCKILVIVFSTLFIVRSILYGFRKKSTDLIQKILLFFGLTLFLIVLVSSLQHLIMNTPFMMDRFALFLYPIFILMCSFLIMDLLCYSYKYITYGFLIILTSLFCWHTCNSLSINSYYNWKCESSSKDMLIELDKIKQQNPSAQIELGVHWRFFSSIKLYLRMWEWNWITLDENTWDMHKNKYYYVMGEDFNKLPKEELEVVKNYQLINNYLVKYDKDPVSKTTIQLKASNGKYLCASTNKNELITADRDQASTWETFTLLNFYNNKCAICSYKNNFLSSELNGKGEIVANRTNKGAWETFTLTQIDTDVIAFKAINGKYLSLDEKSQQIFANADTIGKNEKFNLIKAK